MDYAKHDFSAVEMSLLNATFFSERWDGWNCKNKLSQLVCHFLVINCAQCASSPSNQTGSAGSPSNQTGRISNSTLEGNNSETVTIGIPWLEYNTKIVEGRQQKWLDCHCRSRQARRGWVFISYPVVREQPQLSSESAHLRHQTDPQPLSLSNTYCKV